MSASQMLNLSDLPQDLLELIANKLRKIEDFVSFGSVFKSMFAAAEDDNFKGLRLRQQPYFMLPVRDDGDDDVRELYSLVDGESIVASVKAPNLRTKKCFESLGWLLAVGVDGNMSLFDPFSDSGEIPLPHQNTLPGYESVELEPHPFIHQMVLSSRPNEDPDFVLMLIVGGLGHLAFWRLGDKTLNKINKRIQHFSDVVYHGNGKFYAIGNPGNIWFIKFYGGNSEPKCSKVMNCETMVPDLKSMYPTSILDEDDYHLYGSMNLYILKTIDNALLVLLRMLPNLTEDPSIEDPSTGDPSTENPFTVDLSTEDRPCYTTTFLVYEVDTNTKSWKEIHSLGSMAVFVGHNSTIALDASRFPSGVIKPNRIYFTEDRWELYYYNYGGGMDIGIYNMETRSVEPFYLEKQFQNNVKTSIWINPCI